MRKKSNNEAQNAYSQAQSAYSAAQTALENAKKALESSKNAYSAAITALYQAMAKVAEKQAEVKSDISKVNQNATHVVTDFGSALFNQAKLNNEKEVKQNTETLNNYEKQYKNGTLDEETYKAYKKEIEEKNARLENTNQDYKASSSLISDSAKQLDSSYKKLTNAERIENTELYKPLLTRLDALRSRVNSYDCSSAPNVDRNSYFCDLKDQLLTKDM